jgi:RNA polymerase I-specific transcription initiation factor RRN3
MLYNILRLVPKSTSDVFPVIAAKFPFWTRNAEDLVWYTTQTIKVLEYIPSLRQKIFELLIDKCLEIDVNIFIKDNGDVVIEAGCEKKDGDEFQDNETSAGVKGSKDVTVDELSDKLDAMLQLLFQHIREASRNTVAGSRQVFYELLPIFESSILTTHKSKFVQYAMFLSCGLESQARENKLPILDVGATTMDTSPVRTDPANSENVGGDDEEAILHRDFASKMLEILIDPYRAVTTRQSCACYLASFISRASFVCPETVCESVSALLRWAEAYVGSLDASSVRAADAREQSERHAVFYTVCQAAFYIMCFRGREAMQFYQKVVANQNTLDGQFDEYPDAEFMNLSSNRWTFLCGHELQPLRFCLESVRSEFLHVAHFFNLIEHRVLQDLVADAKRLSTGRVNKKAACTISTAATLERRRQNGGVGGLGRGSNPLKSFFPFDPLLLRRSHEFVEPLYRHWQGPVEEDDVLVIDNIEGHDTEAMFEIDETMGDSEEESSEEEEDDDESQDCAITARDTSEFVSDPETNEQDPIYGSAETHSLKTPEVYERKILQQKAWTEALKRPRSQSMENGSW